MEKPNLSALVGALALALALSLVPGSARGARTKDAAAATVFIRVIGTVEVKVDSAWTETAEERDVEIGTGSGFVFTEYGHILTNHHVISGDVVQGRLRGRDAEVRVAVERIEVVFPSAAGGVGSQPAVYEATLEASDPELDLAVLAIGGGELPYLALGDSDASAPGEQVTVYGFPFGRKLEVGQKDVDDIVPNVTVTRGAMSATRAGVSGEPAFLQTSATVNPGNSGGPMVDAEGFVLGVIRLKLRGGDGIGFAVPVNTVKDFLEFRGYVGLLPTERLRLGPEQTLEGKGLMLALPDALEDRSPVRLRAFSDPAEGPVTFVVDRAASPWELSRLEGLLLSGGVFGGFQAGGAGGQPNSHSFSGGRLIVGWASGIDMRTGEEAKMQYALFDAGVEKVMVRYEGSAEAVAFNRSVLDASLASIRAEPLLTAEVRAPIQPDESEWVARGLPAPGAPFLVVPEDWQYEPAAPFPCRELPVPDSALSASPQGDFTVSLRSGFWRSGPPPLEARRRCRSEVGRAGEASYAYSLDWLGVGYAVDGLFFEREGSLVQLEIVTPVDKSDYVAALAREFFGRNGNRK